MENLLEKFKNRTSCKNFDPKKKISDEDLREIIEFFRLCPSMLNTQPWKIFVVTNPLTKLKLKSASGNQGQIAVNSHYLIFARRQNFDGNFISELAGENILRQEKLENFFKNFSLDEAKNWAISQVSVALGCVIPFLAEKNIDACPIWVLDREKYDEILGLNEKWFASVFGLAIGYAAEKKISKNRLPTEQIVEFL